MSEFKPGFCRGGGINGRVLIADDGLTSARSFGDFESRLDVWQRTRKYIEVINSGENRLLLTSSSATSDAESNGISKRRLPEYPACPDRVDRF